MCPHDKFTIIYYGGLNGVIVRRCDRCNNLELFTEFWVRVTDIKEAIRKVEEG